MKMMKNWKRFCTLDRHHAEGFTLVELIVVIAILAILAGVAVPAYSGYINEANKTADVQLIADIEKALTLAGYAGEFNEGEGGYIILSTNGIQNDITGTKLEQALIGTFGTGYADALKLSYDNWGNSGLTNGLSGVMAQAVKGSSYMTGSRVDALLGDVEKMTGMAQNLVSSLSAGAGLEGTTLSGLFGADVLNETGKKYGIGGDNWTTEDWDEWGSKDENKTTYSNLLVLAAADDIESNMETGEFSDASNLIVEFSSYYAFAATNPEFSEILDAKLESLQSVDGLSAGKAWYDDLEAAAVAKGYDSYRYTTDDAGEQDSSGQYTTDRAAFVSLMAGLGNPTDDQAKILAKDLNNANLFTDGVGNAMYNDYLDAVGAVSSIFGMEDMEGIVVPEGCVAVMFSQTGIETVLFNTLPTE